jgi:hypothetical protein
LKIGPEITLRSDEAILELFNDTLRAQAQLAAEYKHVAVEVPLGSPQVKYFARGNQWCPRGGVLRCLIEDDETAPLVVIASNYSQDFFSRGSFAFLHRCAWHSGSSRCRLGVGPLSKGASKSFHGAARAAMLLVALQIGLPQTEGDRSHKLFKGVRADGSHGARTPFLRWFHTKR